LGVNSCLQEGGFHNDDFLFKWQLWAANLLKMEGISSVKMREIQANDKASFYHL
jgi:hypothetical protein